MSVISIAVLLVSALIGYLLELGSQVPAGSKQLGSQHSELAYYHLPLGILLVTQTLLTFSYIRFSKEELWRFPQTALQPYLTFAVVIIFVSKHIVPYQLIYFLSDTLINCTVLPLVRGLRAVVGVFVG